MSKPYKVDTWIEPFEDFPEGTEIHTRELEHELVCSEDEKRAYVKEGDKWVLFEIVEKAASNPPGDKIECAYLDKVSTETGAKAFIEGRLKKHVALHSQPLSFGRENRSILTRKVVRPGRFIHRI